MDAGGRRYRLTFYQYMLDRWWPMIMGTGLIIFLNVICLWAAEWFLFPAGENPLPKLSVSGGSQLLAVTGICFFFSVLLLAIRKVAYLQCFNDHLLLATPFLRMNISFKRITNSKPAQFSTLVSIRSLSGWYRDILEPVAGGTVVVLSLTSYPLPRWVLRLFLSSFFFYDDSPHFMFFLDDWMKFNTELESNRIEAKRLKYSFQTGQKEFESVLDDLK